MNFVLFWLESIRLAILSTWGAVGAADLFIALVGFLNHERWRNSGPNWLRGFLSHPVASEKWRLPAIFVSVFVVITLLWAPCSQYKRLEKAGQHNVAQPPGLDLAYMQLSQELTATKKELARREPDEWPPLTDAQIEEWARALAPMQVTHLHINWKNDVNAHRFYVTLQQLGKKLGCEVEFTEEDNAYRPRIMLFATKDDPLGPVLLRLFREVGDVQLQDGIHKLPGQAWIFLPRKPIERN